MQVFGVEIPQSHCLHTPGVWDNRDPAHMISFTHLLVLIRTQASLKHRCGNNTSIQTCTVQVIMQVWRMCERHADVELYICPRPLPKSTGCVR